MRSVVRSLLTYLAIYANNKVALCKMDPSNFGFSMNLGDTSYIILIFTFMKMKTSTYRNLHILCTIQKDCSLFQLKMINQQEI